MLLNKNPLKIMKGAKSVIKDTLFLTNTTLLYKIKSKIIDNYMIFDVYIIITGAKLLFFYLHFDTKNLLLL